MVRSLFIKETAVAAPAPINFDFRDLLQAGQTLLRPPMVTDSGAMTYVNLYFNFVTAGRSYYLLGGVLLEINQVNIVFGFVSGSLATI